MAAPLTEGMRYFPHATNASSDIKIAELRLLHGNDGYAFYFIILELAYQNNDGKVSINSENKIKILAKLIGITVKKFETLVKVCVNLKLFDENILNTEKSLTSFGILKRIGKVNDERDADRNRKKNKSNSDRSSDGIPADSGSYPALKESKEKVKEIKVKENEIKEKESKEDTFSHDKLECNTRYPLLATFFDLIKSYNPNDLVCGNIAPHVLTSCENSLKILKKSCELTDTDFESYFSSKINTPSWSGKIAQCRNSPAGVIANAAGYANTDLLSQPKKEHQENNYQKPRLCPQEIPEFVPTPKQLAEMKAEGLI
jgi:hypothetical protein